MPRNCRRCVLPLPLRREARRDSEYKRCGTANVFCAVEPKAGWHFTFATPNRSGSEFAQVIFELAIAYPQANTIHLVLDNLNIHRRKSLTDLLGEQTGGEVWDRFTVHYAPTHGSWLNQQRSKSACFRDSAWAHGVFQTGRPSQMKSAPGIAIPTGTDRKQARRKFGYKRKNVRRSQN